MDAKTQKELNDRLNSATNQKDWEEAKSLLDQGANVRTNEDWPLRHAATLGDERLVRLFLERGANPHAKDESALRWSAEAGHTEVVALILEYGRERFEQEWPTKGASWALAESVGKGHEKTARLLLSKYSMGYLKNIGGSAEKLAKDEIRRRKAAKAVKSLKKSGRLEI
jgi:ankyrin repeat protein